MVDTEIFVAEPELSSNQVGWQLQITDLPGSNSVLTDAKESTRTMVNATANAISRRATYTGNAAWLVSIWLMVRSSSLWMG